MDTEIFSIRKGQTSDLPIITRLNEALFDFEMPISEDKLNKSWSRSSAGQNYFHQRLTTDTSVVLVAVHNESRNVIGYISGQIYNHPVRKQSQLAEIENMIVSEEFRGQGVGTELIRKFEKIAFESGAPYLRVTALSANAPGVEFYRKHGFGDYEIIMEKKVSFDND